MTDSQTRSQHSKIDFTEMLVTHDALRRDLKRLEAAAAAGRTGVPEVRAGWENFKNQLLIHHSVEDAWLWPHLVPLVADRPEAIALLEDMASEHARLDPLLQDFDKALGAGATDLVERTQELAAVLDHHLRHEEEAALPLIQSVMTPKQWRGFKGAMARRQGIRGAAVWVPWITDEMPAPAQRRFLAKMPPPLRVFNRLARDRRYRERRLWHF